MLNKKLLLNTIIFSVLLLIPVIPGFLYAQSAVKPKITVFPLENLERDLQIDVISRNVQRTVELNLKMMDKYIVENNNITTYSGTDDWLLNYSTKNNIDNIIFGKAVIDNRTGSVMLQMSVFNKASKSTTLTKTENAETLFDIFKASDLLAIGMIEGFSGLTLGFGELKFTNSGEKGKYSVYIDNVFAGEDVTNLSTIMTGNKNVKITQARMFGNYVLYNNKELVEEKKITEVVFNIPGFLERESKTIVKEENTINKNWDDKYSSKQVDGSFKKLFDRFKVEGYSESEAAKKKEIEERYAAWEKQKENWPGRITMLDKPFGVSFFFGGGWYEGYYDDKTDGLSSNDYNRGEGGGFKAGAAFSVNMPYNLALQTGFEYTSTEVKFREDHGDEMGITRGGERIDLDLVEVPLFIMYKLPGKYVSIYGGPVFQVKARGNDYAYHHGDNDEAIEDFGMPVGNSGWAIAGGIKGEMPISKSAFLELGIRYTKGLTDKWIDDEEYQTLSINYFNILLGFGVKFGK